MMMEQIHIKSTITGLVVPAFLKFQATVGVLLLLVRGARRADVLHTSGKITSWRKMAESSRSKLVIPLVGLPKLVRLSQISLGHSKHHTKLEPS